MDDVWEVLQPSSIMRPMVHGAFPKKPPLDSRIAWRTRRLVRQHVKESEQTMLDRRGGSKDCESYQHYSEPHRLSTVFPHLLNTPLIEYSNILYTEVVHGLGSLSKIIKFKRVYSIRLIEYQNQWTFFPIMHGMVSFSRRAVWYAAVYSTHSGPTLWTPAATVNRHNCSHLDMKVSSK